MTKNWESTFASWAQGPSATEKERAENAERQIRKAIQTSDKLKNRNIKVFTQGSYRNRVNVKKDSDVDVGVLCYDTYFPEYPDDNVKAKQYNLTIPTKYEIAISFLFYFSLAILSFYVFMWIFALIFPISILIILFTTSKLSRYIRLKLNKQSFIGLIGVLQIVVLFGLYKYT